MTYSRVYLASAIDTMAQELGEIVERICRRDPVLDLRFEDGAWWRVYDVASLERRPLRSTDRLDEAKAFAHAYMSHHGGRLGAGWAEAEENDRYSRAVPSNVVALRREVPA